MKIHSDQAEEYIKIILEYVSSNSEVFDDIVNKTELEPEKLEAFLDEVAFTCEDVIL